MKKLIMIVITLFFLIQATVIAVHAERDISNRKMGRHGNCLYDVDLAADAKLNLTPEQAGRIRALYEKYASDIEPLRMQLREKGKALKTEWLRTEPDRNKIASLRDEVVNLNKQMREKIAGHRADVFDVLTAEQRVRALEIEAEFGRGFRHRLGRFWPSENSGSQR